MMRNVNWWDHLVNLFVVIIGITIAFALNNFAESKKERKLETAYLKSLHQDLEEDISQLETIIDTSAYWMQQNRRLTEVVLRREFQHDSAFYFVVSLYSMAEFTPQDNTYQTLMSSGNFYLIKDFELRKQITAIYNTYYKDINYLDGLHRDLQTDKITPYLNQNVKFSGRPILKDTDFMQDNYFINLSFNNLNILRTKMESYQKALTLMEALQKDLDTILKEE